MPTDDTQVLVVGTASAPRSFVIPGNGQIRPKIVYAKYDGSGASGSFVPALKILSDGGQLLGIAPTCQPVAAGGSAAVTWFPWLDDCCCQQMSAGGGGGGGGTITTIANPTGTLTITNPTGPVTDIDMPTTGVSAGTYGDSGHVAQLSVDAEGRLTAASNVAVGGGAIVGADGWVDDTAETWTYSSATAFTISGSDLTAKYSPGTRVKLTQSATVKYFLVSSSTFAASTTTVNITGGTDYTLANSAISANFHTYVINPQGFPTWFNFAPSISGATGGTTVSRFSALGRRATVAISYSGMTSSSTAKSITLPFTPANVTNMQWVGMLVVEDAGIIQNTPGEIIVNPATASASIYKNNNAAGWTNSGTWLAIGQVEFEI